jgi:hypothetical protein
MTLIAVAADTELDEVVVKLAVPRARPNAMGMAPY